MSLHWEVFESTPSAGGINCVERLETETGRTLRIGGENKKALFCTTSTPAVSGASSAAVITHSGGN